MPTDGIPFLAVVAKEAVIAVIAKEAVIANGPAASAPQPRSRARARRGAARPGGRGRRRTWRGDEHLPE